MQNGLSERTVLIESFVKKAFIKNRINNKSMNDTVMPDSAHECEKRIIDTCDTLSIETVEPSRQMKERNIAFFLSAENIFIHMFHLLEDSPGNIPFSLFIRLIACQIYIHSFMTDYENDLDFYKQFAFGIIKSLGQSPGQNEKTEAEAVIFLKRCLYLIGHNSCFMPVKQVYARCSAFILDDLNYSKGFNRPDYIRALIHFIDISYDHLAAAIGVKNPYVTLESVLPYENSLLEIARANNETDDDFLVYSIHSALFKLQIYRLKQKIHNGLKIPVVEKVTNIKKCISLILFFFGEKEKGYEAEKSFIEEVPKQEEYQRIIHEFGKELTLLLKEDSLNTTEPLFLLFQFLSLFPDYKTLNQNVFKRLAAVSKKYYNRKIFVLSSFLYIKSLDDETVFRRDIAKIKNYIEEKPVTCLISLYNSEVDSLPGISEKKREKLHINHYTVDILKEVRKIETLIKEQILIYIDSRRDDPFYNEKKLLLNSFKHDLNNTLVIAADPTLCKNLNIIYSLLLDKYVGSVKMGFRENFTKRINQLKLSVTEINPMNIAEYLMFYKLGKGLWIMNCKDPNKLKKNRILKENPEDIKHYLEQITLFFEKNDVQCNADSRQIKKVLQEAAGLFFLDNTFIEAEGRLTRLLIVFLQDILHFYEEKKFLNGYYEKGYIRAGKVWLYDPILIYFLNEYFSAKKTVRFINYLTNGSIEYQTKSHMSSYVQDIIFKFIHDQAGRCENGKDNLASELDSISRMDCISLIEKNDVKKEITLQTVKSYVANKKTLVFEKTILEDNDLIYIDSLLTLFLTYVGKRKAAKTIFYILRGLITNAYKGNLKRLHFFEKGLDINKKYGLGMQDFHFPPADKTKKINKEVFEKAGLTIRLEFTTYKDRIIISVINNYQLHPEESEMINKRILLAKELDSLEKAYMHKLKNREGEGLGLVVTMLLLKKLGFTGNNFKIESIENETRFMLTLPIADIKEVKRYELAGRIAREVDNIPMIPEHIQELKKMITDSFSDIHLIESVILKDPSLSAIVLKTANSAFYSPMGTIETVLEGIKILGNKGLNNLLTIFGAYKLLENEADKERVEKIIEHSEKTAFFVKELIEFKNIPIKLDDIFLPALLHDMGKLIIEGLVPEIYYILEDFETANHIPRDVLEDLMGGLYHDIVGYILAKKWNFSPRTCDSIKFHHHPRESDAYFDEVFTIYLANELTHYTERKIVFENLDKNVLNFFDIDKQEQLDTIGNTIKNKYETIMAQKLG